MERGVRDLLLVLPFAAGAAASQGLPHTENVSEPVVLAAGCAYEFGTGNFKWCLSETGNLQRLTSPAGAEHVAVGIVIEGYAICAGDVDHADYHDRGGLPGVGFGPPVVLAGPTSTGITISRTTLDGLFRLDQKWSADAAERDLTVEMTLYNLGWESHGFREFFLTRFADLDLDGAASGNAYALAHNGAWVRRINAVSMIDRGSVLHSSTLGTTTRDGFPYMSQRSDYSGLELACEPAGAIWSTPATGADVAPTILFYFATNFDPGDRGIARVVYRVE